MFEEMWNLGRAALSTEAEPTAIIAAMSREMGDQLEQEFWYVGSVFGRIPIGILHLDDQPNTAIAAEEYLYYLQSSATLSENDCPGKDHPGMSSATKLYHIAGGA